MKKWALRTIRCAAAVSLLGAAMPVQAMELDTYSQYAKPSYEDTYPVTPPVWSDSIDHESAMVTNFMVSGNGNVFYLKNKALIAADASSGQTKWKFGSSLKSSLLYDNASIYTVSEQGTLSAVDAGTGKPRWSATGLPDGSELATDGSILFVGREKGLSAFDAETGEQRWTFTDPQSNSAFSITVLNDVVLQTYSISGAITRGVLVAFDKITGEKLWGQDFHSSLLADDGAYIYAVANHFMVDEPNTVTVNKIHAKSGEIAASRQYVLEPGMKAGKVAMSGDQLLIWAGGAVYSYYRDADPDRTKPVIWHLGALNKTNAWVAGPNQGRFFYSDGTDLEAYNPSMQRYTYYGVDNPFSRLEIHDNGVFVGQTDGQFKMFNAETGTMLLRANTPARLFQEFLVEGDMVLVQAEKQLLAFKLPAEAKQTPVAAGGNASVVEAEANLEIDGKKTEFQPDPVFLNNQLFVPFRALFSAVGATIDYESETQTVRTHYQQTDITFRPYEAVVNVNGSEVELSNATFLHHDTIYIPLRDVSNLLGAEVVWKDATRTVKMKTGA